MSLRRITNQLQLPHRMLFDGLWTMSWFTTRAIAASHLHSSLAATPMMLNSTRRYSEQKKNPDDKTNKKKGLFPPLSKELQLEVSRGYYWDLSEARRDPKAKFFKATTLKKEMKLVPESEANTTITNVDGVKLTFNTLFSGERQRPALVICTQQHHLVSGMVKSWTQPFYEKFGEKGRVIEIITLARAAERLFSFVYRILASKSSHPAYRSDVYLYKTSNEVLSTHLRTKNRYVAYVFLVDKNGDIRWKAVGQAEEDEIESVISMYEQLLLE